MGFVLLQYVLSLLVAGVLAWAFVWVWHFLAIGAAYKSKILCTTIFGSRRDVDPKSADEISADAYWFLTLFHARVDRAQRSVTTSLLGLRPQTAIHRDGLGATLAHGAALPGLKARPTYTPAIPWSVGISPPSLQKVIELAFREANPRRLRRTRAIVVVKDGRIVGERYAPGIAEDTPLPGWSMTKSVLGTLVGILVGEGTLSLSDTELLPEWKRPDPRADIRLEDLLRMRSGLRFVESYSNPGSDVVRMLFAQPDAARFSASLPLTAKPGTAWSYASGTTNILSRIVRARVGEEEYSHWPRRVLFDPIGMTSAVMEPDASGTFVASSFMLATARDWARLGQLYLQDGIWDGQRVLSQSWIRFSTSPTPQSDDGMYGAHWWLTLQPELGGGTAEAARIPEDAFFALGHEGQTLTVIPSRGLVIVRLGLSIYIDAWNHAAFVADVLDAV